MYEFHMSRSDRYRLGKLMDGMFLWIPKTSYHKYECTYKCLYDFIPFVVSGKYSGYLLENGKIIRQYSIGKVTEEF